MQNYREDTGVVNWTNSTGSDVSAGDVINMTNRIGIAIVDIADEASGAVMVRNVFELAKDTSVIAMGDEVYWDVSATKISTTQGADDPRAGIAVEAAATGKGYVDVDINRPRTAGGDDAVDSGAGDAAANAAAIIQIIGILEDAGIAKKQ